MPLVEEWELLNTPTSEGGEIPSEDLQAIRDVLALRDDVVFLARAFRGEVAIEKVDGNDSTVQVRRRTAAAWTAENPILAVGEEGLAIDLNPVGRKIGDGLTPWNELDFWIGTDFTLAEVTNAAAAAAQSAAEAASAEEGASAESGAALQARSDAVAAATDARLWASADIGQALEGGEKSAKAYAADARNIAQLSRALPATLPGALSYPLALAPSHLFQRHRYAGSGAATVTIPRDVWQGPNEGWVLFRNEGSGSLAFQAETLLNSLITPRLLAHSLFMRRVVTTVETDLVAGPETIALPAVVAGMLIVVASRIHNNATGPRRCSLTAGGVAAGLTFTKRTPPPVATLQQFTPEFEIFTAPLTNFVAGDATFTVSAGPFVNAMHVTVFVIEDIGTDFRFAGANTAANASTVPVTLNGVLAQSLALVVAVQRNYQSQSVTLSGVSLLQSGNSLGVPTGDDTAQFRNLMYGLGSGSIATAGNTAFGAQWSGAQGQAGICAIALGPKTGAQQLSVSLIAQGGRTTLTGAGMEAELHLPPDGRTAFLKIPPS